MKKILSCFLILALLCCTAAFAEVPKLNENMYKYAKNTLACLASGAYDKIVTSLPFSGVSPSGREWRDLAEGSFDTLAGATPQKQFAVAYWNGMAWKIAVPVAAPTNGKVEALVLLSEDGRSFSGYGCAIWEEVEEEYNIAEYVQWNEEYNPSTSVIIEFDQ